MVYTHQSKNRDYQTGSSKIMPSTMYFPQETHFTYNDIVRLKVKRKCHI